MTAEVIMYEGAEARSLNPATRAELFRALLEKGYAVSSMRGDLASVAVNSATVVLGSFGGQSPGRHDIRDVDGLDTAGVLSAVEQAREEAAVPAPGKWKPWFPVLDYKRCTNCMQCLSFCLFDVYGVSADGKIQVQNQSNCKTDCPACSRVCPEVAILFPKYKKGPINGDVVKAEDVKREAMKIDISALLGGDLYASLRDRQQTARQRFSTERDESRALLERKRCLKELGKELDIPDEVLMSLPSVGD